MFYDGDFNGVGLDFKTDGTYIYDDWAIGISEFQYGTYTINGDKISINDTNRCVTSRLLEIRNMEYTTYQDSVKKEKYLFQVDDKGEVIDDLSFRVVEDNRHKTQ